ncbi:MAG: zinc ribbon domain-containing protein [Actinobacteria bacterium]|nr:zinc ribbon domain-containing protein [Actinomycetota bacterium]
MPVYEYKCKACGKVFDVLTSFNNLDKKAACEFCGSKRTVKLISGFAFKSEGKMSSSSKSCTTCSATSCSTCK